METKAGPSRIHRVNQIDENSDFNPEKDHLNLDKMSSQDDYSQPMHK